MFHHCLPILVLVALSPALTLAQEKKENDDKGIMLFNGKNLDGWVIDGPTEYKDKADGNKLKPLWMVEDNTIRCAGAGFGLLRGSSFDPEVTCPESSGAGLF